MAIGSVSGVIEHLRRSVMLRDGDGWSDGRLLESFLAQRDEAAFEALVRRHGAMVLGVCRRVLGNCHDAEDAFQAAFLVLVRKAASIQPPDLVGNWLHGVAYRTALKAKSVAAKQRSWEKQVREMPATVVFDEPIWRDLQALLDAELERLPAKHRVAVVLCDLEGKSRREAARLLGWPEGTLSTRLTKARQILARRLTRRGVALSAGALAATLASHAAMAGVPPPLLVSTVKAATFIAAGQAMTGLISAQVAALTQGVLQAMFLTKLKTVMAILMAVALLGTGAGLLMPRSVAEQPASGPIAVEPIAALEPMPALSETIAEELTAFVGGHEERKPATIAGKIVGIAKDSKGLTIEASPRVRGDEAVKHEIKLTAKTEVRFSGVGIGEAKLREGYLAQVWTHEDHKDVATKLHVLGKEGARQASDISGRVTGVSKDGATLTFRIPPQVRGEEEKVVEIRLKPNTVLVYSYISKGGTKPAEGYYAEVWLARGSKDTAARVAFGGTEERPQRGVAEPKPDGAGKVITVADAGKTLTLEIPPQARGDEPSKLTVKIDDKTRLVYHGVGPNGDRPAEGYVAHVWLAEGAKDTAARIVFRASPKDASLRGRVVEVAKDKKSVTLEMPPTERGGEAKRMTIKLVAHTRVVFQKVPANGAQLTEGYFAQVWLEDGSQDSAAQMLLFPAAEGRR